MHTVDCPPGEILNSHKTKLLEYHWSWQTYSVKGRVVNILGFGYHSASAATTQLCVESK